MLKVVRKSLRYFQEFNFFLGQMLPKYIFNDIFLCGRNYPLLTNHAHCMTIIVNRKAQSHENTRSKCYL